MTLFAKNFEKNAIKNFRQDPSGFITDYIVGEKINLSVKNRSVYSRKEKNVLRGQNKS